MYLNLNNKKIFYKTWSETSIINIPIIFLHDSFGCTDLWRDFPEKVSNILNVKVISYDRQGYGKSDPFIIDIRENNYMEKEADSLIGFMDKLKIEKAILFGHSDGATISLIAGAKYPNRINAIISEAAHIFVENLTISGIKSAVELFKTGNLKQKLMKYHGEKTELLFRLWSETWLSERFRHWNIEHLLSLISCPILLIQGEDDEFGTLRQVHSISEKVKGKCTKLILPKVGHTPHKENADLILKNAISFLNPILKK